MFEKYGEFDSAEEINACAAGLKEEGDEESLYAMAEENGISREDVEDYLDGCVDILCSPLMAAIGKIEIEEKELRPSSMVSDSVDWVNYIKNQCVEDVVLASAIRRKGKRIEACITEIYKEAYKARKQVKSPDAKMGNVECGVLSEGNVNRIIKEYYFGG